jgi:hypothetical protein
MQERRFTPSELKERLMEYHRAAPLPMSEEELSQQVDQTTIHRYRVGDQLLEEVQKTLRDIAANLPEGEAKNEAVLAISKIDKAAQEIVYGALNLNKGMPFAKPILKTHHVNYTIK